MTKKYQITCDLFTIPYNNNNNLLYAPRVGFLCVANEDLIDLVATLNNNQQNTFNQKQIQVLNYLEEQGILNGSVEAAIHKHNTKEFKPVRLTLFPTNQCNLRCKYCYASAGDQNPQVIDWLYAVKSIDKIIGNAIELKTNFINIGFHGGGEPLHPWTLIKKIVSYAEEQSHNHNLKLSVYSATNGLLSEKQLEWIIKHFVDLNISFDGLPHVQDYHRPLPDGQGSFKFVDKTFRFLDKRKFNYGIRGTFSDYNIDLMEESFDFIVQNYKPRTIHFEPVFQCGRCKTNTEYEVNMNKFAEYYQKCEQKSHEYGVRFTYSGCRVETLANTFCGVACDNFSVTPDGNVTACYEITSTDEPKSDTFFFGKYNDDGELIIDEEKRKFLKSLSVENIEYCKDCFAKWHCAGDCVAKLGHDDYKGERGHDRCRLNRKMVRNKLISLIEKKI